MSLSSVSIRVKMDPKKLNGTTTKNGGILIQVVMKIKFLDGIIQTENKTKIILRTHITNTKCVRK